MIWSEDLCCLLSQQCWIYFFVGICFVFFICRFVSSPPCNRTPLSIHLPLACLLALLLKLFSIFQYALQKTCFLSATHSRINSHVYEVEFVLSLHDLTFDSVFLLHPTLFLQLFSNEHTNKNTYDYCIDHTQTSTTNYCKDTDVTYEIFTLIDSGVLKTTILEPSLFSYWDHWIITNALHLSLADIDSSTDILAYFAHLSHERSSTNR